MRSTFFVIAAAGIALADDASNFNRDTTPQGYNAPVQGSPVTQISDGQIQAPAYTPAPSSPVESSPVESSAAAPPVYSSVSSTAAPPVYSSVSSAAAPPVYSSVSSAAAPPVYSSVVTPAAPVESTQSVYTPVAPTSPVSPPAYTPPAAPTTPLVIANATTPAVVPYPTGAGNGTTLATSAASAPPTSVTPSSPAQQSSGAVAGVQLSLGMAFAGLFALFL